MPHIILLVQTESNPETRSFCDYENLNDCLNHVCSIYERMLRERYPEHAFITYNLEQLFRHIDEYPEMCCLVYQRSTGTYQPYLRDWIKDQIYYMLEQAASAPGRTPCQ